MNTYISKPSRIEAVQFDTVTAEQCAALVGATRVIGQMDDRCFVVDTQRGPEIARPGDYVLRRECGDVAVMKREAFEQHYAPAGMRGE